MCGCSSGGFGFLSSSSSSKCGGQYSSLQDARNKLAIMFNLEKDPEKRATLKQDKDEVDQLLYESANGACPSYETVSFIVKEVNNEFATYS
jgi:hypothetical protein